MSLAPEPVKPRKRKSIEDIIDDLTDLSDDPDAGPDRFRALKMLASMNSAATVLPEPLDGEEMIERFARLAKPLGLVGCKRGLKRAFPQSRAEVDDPTVVTTDDLPEHMKSLANMCYTTKRLYKMIPELKRNGIPPGYPMKGGEAIRMEFCRNYARRYLRDKWQMQLEKEKKLDEKARDDAPQVGS